MVIGAHYDSCICAADRWDATSDAPGADDDGSGTSAVLEVARALSRRFPDGMETTVLFALYAGEEQGLLGSTALAERLAREGYVVLAAMTDDIVGNVTTEDGRTDSTTVRIFAGDPDNGPGRELARYAVALGAVYDAGVTPFPVLRLDRIGRGGDHIPFHRQGLPAVRFSERLEHYGRQHLPTDTLAAVSFPYVARVARLNAATVASLALAPPPPDSVRAVRDRASGGQRFRVSWTEVPAAAEYEIVLRRTTAPGWERGPRSISSTRSSTISGAASGRSAPTGTAPSRSSGPRPRAWPAERQGPIDSGMMSTLAAATTRAASPPTASAVRSPSSERTSRLSVSESGIRVVSPFPITPTSVSPTNQACRSVSHEPSDRSTRTCRGRGAAASSGAGSAFQ